MPCDAFRYGIDLDLWSFFLRQLIPKSYTRLKVFHLPPAIVHPTEGCKPYIVGTILCGKT